MTRKLKLDLDELSVESFTVQGESGEDRGTVHGHSADACLYDSYRHCPLTEPGSDSYGEATCGWTCANDCFPVTLGGGGWGGTGALTGQDERLTC